MGWLADRRNSKKMGDFIVRAAQRGGTFETSCAPEEILGWLKSGRCQVADESPVSLTVRPIHGTGAVGSELIKAEIQPGVQLLTRVVITVELKAKPGNINLNALSPITRLIDQVSKVDPGWLPM